MSEQWDYRPGTLVPGTKYQIVAKLGAGGMGTVYEVEDVSVEKRFVLKTIHVRYAGHNVAVERFVREAKALGKLEHKNIVQVITAGVTEDALQLRYFVMEKLSGHSLRTVLHSKGALALDAACHFMIELLSALNCAHDAGIVHRDIKPENIFVSKDSMGTTTLKLLDFGIMSSTGTRTSDRKGFMGTARYAAPEMQTPDYEATPLADIYSASLVFYEMVCGSGPYDELEEVPDLLEAHRVKPPPKPALFRPGIPESLQGLILRGLAKDPKQRPVDAFSFAEEVNAIRSELRCGAPSVTSKVSPPSEATLEKIISSARTREGAITPAPEAMMPPSERFGLPPQLSPTSIDEQAAKLFVSASGPASRPH
ncbi:MAG: serine/threonine protein kinase, partial [Polyangiaceae bacterium]